MYILLFCFPLQVLPLWNPNEQKLISTEATNERVNDLRFIPFKQKQDIPSTHQEGNKEVHWRLP